MVTLDLEQLEPRIQEVGQQLLQHSRQQGPTVFQQDWWDARILEWCMQDEALKVQIFRFVDVLPSLGRPEMVAQHLQEYFGDHPSVALQWGLRFTSPGSLAARAVAQGVRRNAQRMARRFIAGKSEEDMLPILRRMRRHHQGFSVALLGEAVVSEEEADGYQRDYLEVLNWLANEAAGWPSDPLIDQGPRGPLPRVHLSVKLSALCPQFEPADPQGTTEAVLTRLRPLLRRVRQTGAFLCVDMEQYQDKELTLYVFQQALMEPEFRDYPHVGIAMQAYLRDAEQDVEGLIAWVEKRGTPITIRLVRGAYWDYERVVARERGWPVPVFEHKWETDACFERLAVRLLQAYPTVDTAFGSHNARSLALGVVLQEALGLPSRTLEFQILYGMADEFKAALLQMGQRVRVYTPFGELIPGMAYFVRRLLENTSQHSFLRLSATQMASPEELLAPPPPLPEQEAVLTATPETVRHEPLTDFARLANQRRMGEALTTVRGELGGFRPALIGQEAVSQGERLISVCPADPELVVGQTVQCTTDHAEQAVRAALEVLPTWRAIPASQRSEVLVRAAALMRARRWELTAWEVWEAGKNWREADADVAEAIDYLDFYAREMLRLAEGRQYNVPGETNDYFYEGRGVALVISPWNFPLAIPCGMASAALVTGNSVILKPASQTPILGALLIEILREAGAPAGAAQFLPGSGSVVGAYLVEHPQVHLIAFTGSLEVGARIYQQAAELRPGQHHLKRVIAELGGKNAIIVDDDADLDDAVTGVIASAFGYGGQKCSACSRVVVLEGIYDLFVRRLVAATRSIRIGPPDQPGSFLTPLIDAAAVRKVGDYVEIGRREGRCLLDPDSISLPSKGFYAAPAIFVDVSPSSRIAQEEIFGPVLCVLRAADFDEALQIANGVPYALTGGLYSRSPLHMERARREFRVGNLYLNRKITGALVGRQPFGGLKLSGIGSKTGGPDYLLQFMEPRTVTENTLRRGFAPE